MYQTYVGVSSNALNSPLYFRYDLSTYPSYNISVNGNDALSFNYGHYTGSLNQLTGLSGAPSGCMNVTAFRMAGEDESGNTSGEIMGNAEYRLYPNPSNGNLTIAQSVPLNTELTVDVFNVLGQKVFNTNLQFAGGKAVFNMGNVAPGIYQVLLSDDHGEIWNKKVVIEKN